MSDYHSWKFGRQVYISNLCDAFKEYEVVALRVERLCQAKRGHAIKMADYRPILAALELQIFNDIQARKDELKEAESVHNQRMAKHAAEQSK
jgi:hypothetical protein